MTLDEISEYIGELHGKTKPQRNMMLAVTMDKSAAMWPDLASRCLDIRDATLLLLTVRALRNQGQPYYCKDRQR